VDAARADPGVPDWAPVKGWVALNIAPWFRWPRIEAVWGTTWIKLGTYKDQVLGSTR